MYSLEIYANNNWSNEIGDYNTFETLEEVHEAILGCEITACDLLDSHEFKWRILDSNGDVIKFVTQTHILGQ